jgi:hypothetical protein
VSTSSSYGWTNSSGASDFELMVTVTSGGLTASDTLLVDVEPLCNGVPC